MGLGTLIGMLLAALAVIGLLATSADYAVFLPQLLQGAALTVEITLLACLLAVVMGVLAALARLYGPAPLRWLATIYVFPPLLRQLVQGLLALVGGHAVFPAVAHDGAHIVHTGGGHCFNPVIHLGGFQSKASATANPDGPNSVSVHKGTGA